MHLQTCDVAPLTLDSLQIAPHDMKHSPTLSALPFELLHASDFSPPAAGSRFYEARLRFSGRFTEVSGAVKTTSMGSEGGEFVTGCRSNMKTDLTHHLPHTQYLVLCLVNVS